jgi:hypothetical protein
MLVPVMRSALRAAFYTFVFMIPVAAQTQIYLYNPPAVPASAIAADVDRNNVDDFVFVSSPANTVNVFLTVTASPGIGSGDPNPWGPFNVYPTGQNPVAVAVADWNNDTYVDLLVANAGSQDISVLVADLCTGTELFRSA